MKRIVLLLGFVCLCGVACAQSSAEILRQMSARIDSLGRYKADFVMTSSLGNANGSYAVDGTKFRIDAGAIELVCDGRTVYEIDHSAKEVAVDNVGYDATIWTNPAKAFSMLDSRFDHRLMGQTTDSAKALYEVRLSGKENDGESFVMLIDTTTLLPYKVTYGTGEQKVSLRIIRIGNDKTIEPSLFEFNSAAHPDYEIIDLR
jgi:outer membrane lipoprotein-sorting protein